MMDLPELQYERSRSLQKQSEFAMEVCGYLFCFVLGYLLCYALDQRAQEMAANDFSVPVSQIDPCTVD